MERNNSTIRLSEQEFNKLIEESVMQILEEGKFGDFAKKVGKGIGNAALYGALGAGSLYGAAVGLDNQDEYEQELNRQAKVLQGPSEEEVSQWIEDHEMEDTPQNRKATWDFLNDKLHESKLSNRLSQIIREEISKVL